MGILNSVSREQYEDMRSLVQDWKNIADDWRTRYDALFAAYEKLRPTHSPSTPIRLSPPREEPGTATLRAIEAGITNPRVRRIADSLQQAKPDLSREGALVEAKRLDDIARGKTVAPSVAPPETPSR